MLAIKTPRKRHRNRRSAPASLSPPQRALRFFAPKMATRKKSACIDASSLQFDSATNREIERDIVLNDAYKIHNHKNDAEQNTNSHQPIAQNAQADDSSPNAPNAPNPGIPQAPNAPNPGIPQDPAMIAPAPNADRGDYNVVVPGAFLSGAPNEIFIQTMRSGEPITSPIEVRQIYGQPIAFETPLTPSPAGIARFSLTLDSAADFEFIQDAHSFYASFSANDKPLHISSAALITEAHSARVTVTPFGNADRVVTDVFDGQAWIAHREDALPNNRTLVISRERLNYDVPKSSISASARRCLPMSTPRKPPPSSSPPAKSPPHAKQKSPSTKPSTPATPNSSPIYRASIRSTPPHTPVFATSLLPTSQWHTILKLHLKSEQKSTNAPILTN